MGREEPQEGDTLMAGGKEKHAKDVNYGHPSLSGHESNSVQFAGVMLVAQIAFIVLFGLFVRYDGDGSFAGGDEELSRSYPWFQDTHVMIVVGFGFLMTFLKRYGFSAVGFNFLLTAFTIQWSILVTGLFHDYLHHAMEAASEAAEEAVTAAPEAADEEAVHDAMNYIKVNLDRMIEADFTTGAILISFGAVLGVASPVQLVFMVLFEVIFYNLNGFILNFVIGVSDIGGSMIIHAFGAYFGLAVARVIYKDDGQIGNDAEGCEYHSDVFSMIGTVFLWMFWPSFNSAPGAAGDTNRYYAVVNTYLALCAACVATFIFSTLFNPKKRITMEHIQNATLAGGVAMGTSADMAVQPYGALCIGFFAGLLSTAGYAYIKPYLQDKIALHDTCGVNNLHGMPAIMAAIVSIITCAINAGNEELDNMPSDDQYMKQLYAILCTLGIAIVSGSLTGAVLRIPQVEHLGTYEYFEDGKYWELEVESDDEEK